MLSIVKWDVVWEWNVIVCAISHVGRARLQVDRHDHAGVTEVRWDIVAPACSLHGNDIGAEGAQHVVRALENNQVLTTL